jgi:tRNA(Arg) A34 adenosine deaminase TadA
MYITTTRNSFTFDYMNISNPFMQRCLQLAAIAQESGESAVGSVVVKGNIILGEGCEESKKLDDVTRHAEVVAMLDAIQKHGKASLIGATLYTNVEPCILCSYVIRTYKIAEVIYISPSGELGGTNPSFPLLTSLAFASWQTPPKVTIYTEE